MFSLLVLQQKQYLPSVPLVADKDLSKTLKYLLRVIKCIKKNLEELARKFFSTLAYSSCRALPPNGIRLSNNEGMLTMTFMSIWNIYH